MKNRAVRFTLHVLFVGIVAAAAYVVWQKESEGAAAASAARRFADRAQTTSRALLEIKSAQPGYVAAGQGEDYWLTKVDTLTASTREAIAAITPLAQTAAARGELGTAAEAFEDFEQVDRRAREYVRGGQRLLASDLVFSDGIGKLEAAVAAIERARITEAEAALALTATQRREQWMAAAGAAVLGVLIMFMLVPLPRVEPAPVVPALPPAEAPVQRVPVRRIAVPPPAAPASAPPAFRLKADATEPSSVAASAVAAVPPSIPQATPASPGIDLPGMAALCTDLARVLDTRALPAALERAAKLLDATGLVIWVADPDGRELAAVMAHGYPANVVSRLGTIPKDAENATAAAFRTGVVQTVKADTISNGAIAAPLLSATGPVGVMAAEVLHDGERKDATRAAAAIVAAQLATLLGPPTARAQGKTEAV
jgi:hypothetical protein